MSSGHLTSQSSSRLAAPGSLNAALPQAAAYATMINRSAVILRPGPPFIEWASKLDDSGIVPSSEGEQTVYLVPEFEDDIEAMEVLSEGYELLFEEQLAGWHTDESAWPSNRTFKMFREWFVIEQHSLVIDLCNYSFQNDDV